MQISFPSLRPPHAPFPVPAVETRHAASPQQQCQPGDGACPVSTGGNKSDTRREVLPGDAARCVSTGGNKSDTRREVLPGDAARCVSTFTTPHSSLITHHSSLITHHSPLITHHSSLITHHSPLITHHSPLPRIGVKFGPSHIVPIYFSYTSYITYIRSI